MRVPATSVSDFRPCLSRFRFRLLCASVAALATSLTVRAAEPPAPFPVNSITNFLAYGVRNRIDKYTKANDPEFYDNYYTPLLAKLTEELPTPARPQDVAWNLINWLDSDRVPQNTIDTAPWWHTEGGEAIPLINEIVLEYDPVTRQATFKVELWFPFVGPEHIKVDAADASYDCDKFFFQAAIWDMPDPQTTPPTLAQNEIYFPSATPSPVVVHERQIEFMQYPNNQWYVVTLPPFSMDKALSDTNSLWFVARTCVKDGGQVYPVDQAGGMKQNWRRWSGSSWVAGTVPANYTPSVYTGPGAWGVDDPHSNGKGNEWHAQSRATLGRNGPTRADWLSGINEQQNPWWDGSTLPPLRQGIPIFVKDGLMESLGELGTIYLSNYAGTVGTWNTIDLMHADTGAELLDTLCLDALHGSGLPAELLDPEYGEGTRLTDLLTGLEIGFEGDGFHKAHLGAEDADRIAAAILDVYRNDHHFSSYSSLFSDEAGRAHPDGGPIADACRHAAMDAWNRDNAGVTNVQQAALHDLVLEGPIRGIIDRGTPGPQSTYVSLSGSDAWPYASWETAARDVQSAIDAVVEGGLVLVDTGEYDDVSLVIDRPITVRSAHGSQGTVLLGAGGRVSWVGCAGAVLDGFTIRRGSADCGAGVYCTSGGVLRCCFITENTATAAGGGIYVGPGSAASNCTIKLNSAPDGGGVYCGHQGRVMDCQIVSNGFHWARETPVSDRGGGAYVSDGMISGCTISGNVAAYIRGHTRSGGGVYAEGSSLVTQCYIGSNRASDAGGGICCEPGASVSVVNCCICSNSAAEGGGSFWGRLLSCTLRSNSSSAVGGGAYYSGLTNCLLELNTTSGFGGGSAYGVLGNCIVVRNAASLGGGIYAGRGAPPCVRSCTIACNVAEEAGGVYDMFAQNCLIYHNQAELGDNWSPQDWGVDLQNCCTQPTRPHFGYTITNDPGFVAAGLGDFRLRPGSPCIDRGANAYVTTSTDIDGLPRIVGGRVDIGAHEYIVSTNDYDGDGLSNDDESNRGTDPTLADSDGDTMADGNEVAADTDPTDPLSLLRILHVTHEADGVSFEWQGGTNVRQYLDHATSLVQRPIPWVPVYTNEPGMPVTNHFWHSEPGPRSFYRIRVGTP